MPANGSAKTTRFSSEVALTGCPAHAALLTATTPTIVTSQTNRFDQRCLTLVPLVRRHHTHRSALVFLGGVDRQLDGGLVVVAVEGAGLGRADAHELAVLHLHADEARAAHLATDVDLGNETVGVELVEVADSREDVGTGDRLRVVVVRGDRVVDR